MYRLNNIKIKDDMSEDEVIEFALKKYNIKKEEVLNAEIYRKSLDARDKENITYNYAIDVELKKKRNIKGAIITEKYVFPNINVNRKSNLSPVIIGTGPCGLFCALILVQNGVKPVIIEQGSSVEKRTQEVSSFLNGGKLNTSSNIQFGEGGAGTFSDGKLNTGNNSKEQRKVLEEFVKFGAPKEILYLAKPHIGTDNLLSVIINMRNYIISKGGKFMFNTKVTDFKFSNHSVSSVITQYGEEIKTDTVVLAIGHSARDTFKKLLSLGVNIRPKNFAVGLRIEHLQSDINKAQYGDKSILLPPADYKLVHHAKNGRVCYSFCMCPGGRVIASTSEEKMLVTNGMSKFMRDGENANSAIVVNITPEDCGTNGGVLSTMYFQEKLEKKAFQMGGGNYYAPIQKFSDYVENKKSENIGRVKPTYMPGTTLSNLNDLFPMYINDAIKEAILSFDNKLKGFASGDAILTAVETRTSSPVQIVRDKDTLESNILGLYPSGEGAGYAGGIMSSAVDGIRVAVKILEK